MDSSPEKVETSERILIVDDDANVRETLTEMVEGGGGWKCESVDSVEKAIDLFREVGFDLVLTDMHMPGQTGLDLIDHIRKFDETVPVILITGFPSIGSAVDAMKRGAIDFIAKPFELNNLLHVVNKALSERRLRLEPSPRHVEFPVEGMARIGWPRRQLDYHHR